MRIVASAYSAGDVIVYPYRWAEERSQARAVDGAKDRPCCLVVDSWYLKPQTPLGAFSRSFLSKVSAAIARNIRAGGIVARR